MRSGLAGSAAATSEFLAPADRVEIEARLASDYFPAVRLRVAEVDGALAGFAGTADDTLEVLVLHLRLVGRS